MSGNAKRYLGELAKTLAALHYVLDEVDDYPRLPVAKQLEELQDCIDIARQQLGYLERLPQCPQRNLLHGQFTKVIEEAYSRYDAAQIELNWSPSPTR